MKEYKFEERTVGNILEDKANTIGEKSISSTGIRRSLIRR